MKFVFKTFNELSPSELYEILRLRAEIFVVEQNCVYNDLDDLDQSAIHQFLIENNTIIAYARILPPGTRFPDFSIGRVVVKKSARMRGLGIELMKTAIDFLRNKYKPSKIKISAQKYLRKFYEDLGFEVLTEEYLEDGIPHFGMMYKNHPEN